MDPLPCVVSALVEISRIARAVKHSGLPGYPDPVPDTDMFFAFFCLFRPDIGHDGWFLNILI